MIFISIYSNQVNSDLFAFFSLCVCSSSRRWILLYIAVYNSDVPFFSLVFFFIQIETIVNPFKSGMRTIKNMPDTLVGGKKKTSGIQIFEFAFQRTVI